MRRGGWCGQARVPERTPRARISLVLMVGTLNRVMIVELNVPASLVAVMVALPVLYTPFRALIGFRSDNHRSALGWRGVPFIRIGKMLRACVRHRLAAPGARAASARERRRP